MVGAVTVLIAIVAVFLAYNANNGLPFVPVYRVSVEVPNAARLTTNNEVRIGGHRVGVVESIEPVQTSEAQTTADSGETVAAGAANDTGGLGALVNLKLDKSAEPLPQDSIFRVRYKSAFGLKYLEVVRGNGEDAPEGYTFDGTDDGGVCTLPATTEEPPGSGAAGNGCFQEQTEFDDIANTFDTETRENARRNLVGYGDAFAGRGFSLNLALENLKPLIVNLKPVSDVLIEPATRLERFFPALGRTREHRRAGRRGAGRALHLHGDDVQGDLLRPRGAEGDDLRRRADAPDRDRDAAAADPVPARLRDALRRPASWRRGPADHAAHAQ